MNKHEKLSLTWPNELVKEGKKILSHVDKIFFITPSKDQALNFMKQSPDKIKVVILGQDPYPQKNVANGYAFAVNQDQEIPKSLQNIFKEIIKVQGYLKANRTLKNWVNQGVLLLNTSLTTEINCSGKHFHFWKDFTEKVILFLLQNNKNIYWVLWGKYAQKYYSLIAKFSKKIILDAHPSPLSYYLRNQKTFEILKKKITIDW